MPAEPIPINDYLRALQTQLADAEWSGDDDRAFALRLELDRVDRAINAGDLWEVPF